MSIILTSYNPNWSELFNREKGKILEQLGGSIDSIEHIGSTAISGMLAKPVIDIMIGVTDLKQFTGSHIQLLESLGYHYIKAYEKHVPNRRFFEKDGPDGNRAYHIHLVNRESAWWKRHILFRNHLRQHREEADKYAALKLEIADALNESPENKNSTREFLEKFIDPFPTLTQEYENLNRALKENISLMNLYALAKSNFIQEINKQAYFDFNSHTVDKSLARLNGYVPQAACFEIYKKMFQDPEFADCYGVTLSDTQLQSILERDTNYWDKHGFGPYVWFEKESKGFVGEGGLNHTKVDGKDEIELTYSLMPEYWGRGIAVEIGEFAVHTAFNELELTNLVCFTMATNQQSLRVIQKLGFEYEKDFTHCNLPHKLFRLKK